MVRLKAGGYSPRLKLTSIDEAELKQVIRVPKAYDSLTIFKGIPTDEVTSVRQRLYALWNDGRPLGERAAERLEILTYMQSYNSALPAWIKSSGNAAISSDALTGAVLSQLDAEDKIDDGQLLGNRYKRLQGYQELRRSQAAQAQAANALSQSSRQATEAKTRIINAVAYLSRKSIPVSTSPPYSLFPSLDLKEEVDAEISGQPPTLLVSSNISKEQESGIKGLVAYFPLDGDAKDESGQHNHGLVAGALPTVDRFGAQNKAYIFNGKNSSIAIPSTAFPAGDYSVSIWFRLAELPVRNDAVMLISRARYDTELHVGIGDPHQATSGVRFLPRMLGRDVLHCDAASANILPNVWTHVVATYEKLSRRARIYVNGIESPASQFSGQGESEPAAMGRVGMRFDGSSPFKGSIDDILIFNRAMTLDEVVGLQSEGQERRTTK